MKIKCPHCDKDIELTISKSTLAKEEKTEGEFKFQYNPLDKLEYTQRFGGWPEFYKQFGMIGHNGVDFRTKFLDSPMGRRHVYAVLDGVISEVMSEDKGGYGKFVRIDHSDKGQTIYSHLHSIKVNHKQEVKAGDIIGISDNTGASTGAHLHFGYRPKNMNYNNGYKGYEDPEKYFL